MKNCSKKRNRCSHIHKKTQPKRKSYVVVCPYCLQEFYNPDDICIDHEYPRSRFKNTKTVKCCKHCNSEKGSLTPEEYALWKALSNAPKEYLVWKRLEDLRNGRTK